MALKNICKSNFYSDIFEENAIPSIYEKIKLKDNEYAFCSPGTKTLPASRLYAFELVPNYFELEVKDGYNCKEIFQKYGYAVNLMGYNSVDNYLKSEFKTSIRKNFNRTKNKLENCYNINYAFFYGAISNEEYYALMHALHEMLKKRFKERNDRNPVLENWEHYVQNTLQLINSKKASLLVIFSDNEPVAITLNYHQGKVIYSAIASYNIDFYKYSLGNLMIYKLIEWAILNHYVLIDLGYGNFSHKQIWNNKRYSFNNHVIHSENVWFGKLYAVFIHYKYQLINYLLSKKVNVYYKNFKQFFKGIPKEEPLDTFKFETIKINHLSNEDVKSLNLINFKKEDYLFMRKPINDFIYSNNNHIDNMSIFKAKIQDNIFYIKGEKCSIKLTYTKN
ncbi:GNAT family N-acetyltransferase [Hwangdonia lutea]|uniref:GNAT family N-acetyltransferase n=1 Tax=Hwangdonia lutea TaxID=3075823 RepID=A0AA97ELD9_9FLAO|nr:GNAT family N-acetyltransferase [Hwangdonia sp. SCSIO 19198]WOD43377.1 GNAT family N-acetyltransferase [Hwangdonia sp. SCSIO 19198]